MHKTIRQMILGFGTFGTGTALLYLDVNPYLLILTDTVVGIGMLFAAGSLTVEDLHLTRKGTPGGGPAAGAVSPPAGAAEEPHGLLASLGKLGESLRPSPGRPGAGKEGGEVHAEEIDRMLDTALIGESKRLISIAEGRGTSPGPAPTSTEPAAPGRDLLQEVSEAGIATAFPGEEGAEEEGTDLQGGVKPPAPVMEEVSPAALTEPEEVRGGVQAEILPLGEGGTGADDLLSALRLEAMKEKKKDDTSLLRDLKGVKVSGKELLEELDNLVREIRRR